MNVYIVVNNNPLNLLDWAGLWIIRRRGGPKARAIAEEYDTAATLAARIGLDPTEYQKWLSADVTYGYMPESVDEILCGTHEIPNTVVAYWADVQGGWPELAVKFKAAWWPSIRYLEAIGFKVQETDHVNGLMFRLRNILYSQSAGGYLHGVYFWGHGGPGALYSEEYGPSAVNDLLLYDSSLLSYRMALALLFACSSDSFSTASNVSQTAGRIFEGKPGVWFPPILPLLNRVANWIDAGDQGTDSCGALFVIAL